MSAGQITQGRRVVEVDEEVGMPAEPRPGDYWKWRGIWWCIAPDTGLPIGNLSNHKITEHEDGTITVSPSILVNFGAHGKTWHGYLERGVWREA